MFMLCKVAYQFTMQESWSLSIASETNLAKFRFFSGELPADDAWQRNDSLPHGQPATTVLLTTAVAALYDSL